MIKLIDNREIERVLLKKYKNKNSLYSSLYRSKENNKHKLIRLKRGAYFHGYPDQISVKEVSNLLFPESYISMKEVLIEEGILTKALKSQETIIESIGTKKSGTINNFFGSFCNHKIREDLFCGFYEKNGIKVAKKEKALFDYLYFELNAYKILKEDSELISKDYNLLELSKKSINIKRVIISLISEFENLEKVDLNFVYHEYAKKLNNNKFSSLIHLLSKVKDYKGEKLNKNSINK